MAYEPKTETFTSDGVTVTCREPMSMDKFDMRVIHAKLNADPKDDIQFMRIRAFSRHVVQTVSLQGLDWWVTLSSPAGDMMVAFLAWQQLPAQLINTWDDTVWGLDSKSF